MHTACETPCICNLLQDVMFGHFVVTLSRPVSIVGGKRRASLVWNEALASGPFPEKKVPIQVWSLGRFKFKGIAGTCKVCSCLMADILF